MAVGVTSQMFQGVTATNRCRARIAGSEMRRPLLPSTPLSSVAYGQDATVLHLFKRNYMPMLYVPCRYRALSVRSFALPVALKEIPLVKSTSLVLTRSCDALLAHPATAFVVPAIGLIFFAVWGFLPLMKDIRNRFDHGGNWKKSPTYLISSSYLQPLLLWTGAILICRGLDPVVLPSAASQAVKTRLLTFVRSLSTVLATACILTSLIQQVQKFLVDIRSPNDTRTIYISCFVKTSHFEEYLNVQETVMLDLLRIVGHHRARLAVPIRTVQKSYGNADTDNIPFGEGTYSRVRGRPLLIDTSARISDDKKPRPASREDQKVKTSVSVDTKSTSADAPGGSSLSNSEKLEEKKMVPEDILTKKRKNDHVKSSTPSPSTPWAGSTDPVTSASKPGRGKAQGSEAVEQGDSSVRVTIRKKEPRPAFFEDNIVLGVALEGSRRTLPIDEGMNPHLSLSEPEQDAVEAASSSKKGQSYSPSGQEKAGQRNPDR